MSDQLSSTFHIRPEGVPLKYSLSGSEHSTWVKQNSFCLISVLDLHILNILTRCHYHRGATDEKSLCPLLDALKQDLAVRPEMRHIDQKKTQATLLHCIVTLLEKFALDARFWFASSPYLSNPQATARK